MTPMTRWRRIVQVIFLLVFIALITAGNSKIYLLIPVAGFPARSIQEFMML